MAKVKEINRVPRNIKSVLDAGASTQTLGSSRRDYSRPRIPTVITTADAEEQADVDRMINCWVNPQEITWSMPQRGALQKVRGGTIRYRWRNSIRKTFFDEFKLGITFTSGNILSNTSLEGRKVVPKGLDDFYRYLSLIDEKSFTANNRENFMIVYHHSPIFPSIALIGYLDPPAGVNFTESAEGGWEVKWTSTFEIVKTAPKVTELDALRRIYGGVS